MKVTIFYGTESGNAETVAEDIVEEYGDLAEIEAHDMTDIEIDMLNPEVFYLVVCSTHGEGDLPSSAQPFADLLDTEKPDLTGFYYAMFGLGDSSHEHYSRGSEHIDERFAALGATRVGEYGRHDAKDGSLPNDEALEWAREAISRADALVVSA